ncbi:hypothetical protein STEG23_014042 [Scotinomys teguina]
MFLSEVETLQRLKHPHIIQLLQFTITTPVSYIILEFAGGGDLWKYTQREGRLTEDKAKKIFGQILSAVRYCHDRDIAHRDLKPENILLDEDGNVKLADFGLAIKCPADRVLRDQCGTMIYFPPEKVLREGYTAKKGDVWSLGVVLFVMTTGSHPFIGSTKEETLRNICTGSYYIPKHILVECGQLKHLISLMVTVIPEMRPSIKDLQQDLGVSDEEETFSSDPYPDPNILNVLSDIGYNAYNILESLQEQRYDNLMGTYLIMEERARKGLECKLHYTTSSKSVDSSDVPPPAAGAPHLKESAHEPTLGLFNTQSSQQHLPVVPKVAKSVSMPLQFPLKTPTCTYAPGSRATYVPCICGSVRGEKIPRSPGPQAASLNSLPLQTSGFSFGGCQTIQHGSGDERDHGTRHAGKRVGTAMSVCMYCCKSSETHYCPG